MAGLEAYCEETGGRNFYRGEPHWISVQFTDAEGAADHHSGDGHEGHDHTHASG